MYWKWGRCAGRTCHASSYLFSCILMLMRALQIFVRYGAVFLDLFFSVHGFLTGISITWAWLTMVRAVCSMVELRQMLTLRF